VEALSNLSDFLNIAKTICDMVSSSSNPVIFAEMEHKKNGWSPPSLSR